VTVYIKIYNVVSGVNKALEVMGFGLYHSSINLFDLEFSYGGHDKESSGIVIVEEGNSAGLELKEKLAIGDTYFTSDEIDDIIDGLGEFWHGCDYDPFARNCNNFTELFA
jgi:deubiquitinase DESI2